MSPRVGFTCAYTPLPLIHAAGFVPHRLLPLQLDHVPDRAGTHLHDNLCPHVKRVLDCALAGALPEELAGMVFVGSCDAMRRLADAWRRVRPDDRTVLLDLPTSPDSAGATAFFADELRRLVALLADWAGEAVTDEQIRRSLRLYDELGRTLAALAGRPLPGGSPALQRLHNRAVTEPPQKILAEARALAADNTAPAPDPGGVPVLVLGNVLPDPQALELIEACGARVCADDLCTGSRQLLPLGEPPAGTELLPWLAGRILARPVCGRTFLSRQPGALAEQALAMARESGARGVIAHVMKFCDPYLARLPAIQQRLREAGLPLLVLEGDCTLRSLGQHRTRIEAFVEMLGGGEP
jgi:benzoyl-CoA reductase/2-hydroxyglutaryl-CoA dehydratase subunit BcrC/BadD/HgdB